MTCCDQNILNFHEDTFDMLSCSKKHLRPLGSKIEKSLDEILCSHPLSAEHGESNCFDQGVAIIQGGKICGKMLLEIARLARCTRDENDQYLGGNTTTIFFRNLICVVVWVAMCISHCQKISLKFSGIPLCFFRMKEPDERAQQLVFD